MPKFGRRGISSVTLLAVVLLALPGTSYANFKHRVCNAKGECWDDSGADKCGDFVQPKGWSCTDQLAFKPSSSDYLLREKGGRAFAVIDGRPTPIASDAFNPFFGKTWRRGGRCLTNS